MLIFNSQQSALHLLFSWSSHRDRPSKLLYSTLVSGDVCASRVHVYGDVYNDAWKLRARFLQHNWHYCTPAVRVQSTVQRLPL